MKLTTIRLGRFLALGLVGASLVFAGCNGKDGDDKENGGKGSKKNTKKENAFDESTATGTVKGKVVFKGEKPEPKKIPISGDEFCQHAHESGNPVQEDEAIVVNDDGTLKNVIVYVESDDLAGMDYSKYEPAGEPVVLDQKGCLYAPHTFGIMIGQPLEIRNSDDTMHNVHFFSDINEAFNETQQKGQPIEKDFTQREIGGRFKCDKHGWMGAWVVVLEHPFHASTGDKGTFELPKLPPGKYKVVAWHEKLKSTEQEIEVKDGETTEVTFEFSK